MTNGRPIAGRDQLPADSEPPDGQARIVGHRVFIIEDERPFQTVAVSDQSQHEQGRGTQAVEQGIGTFRSQESLSRPGWQIFFIR